MIENPFAVMALSDLRGEASPEEIEFLSADENVEDWQRWLTDYALQAQSLLKTRRIKFEGKRNRHRQLPSHERVERKVVEGWEDYKEEYFAFVAEAEELRVAALMRAGYAKKLVKDLKQRRHIERQGDPGGRGSDQRLRAALDRQRDERNAYREILFDVQKQLLENPEFFSEVGESVRMRLLEKVEQTLHPKSDEDE